VAARDARVPQRPRQALDAQRDRPARAPPCSEGGKQQREAAGLPPIREQVTPHTLRYTCIASLFAAGADQEYVADQVGHEDVTTTNRIYRYVLQRRRRGEIGRRRQLAMRESATEVGRTGLSHADVRRR
jgi:integrase